MNNDLISREALKKALKSNCDLCHDKNTNWCEHCCPLNDFEDLIDNAPTVEAFTEEGEWEKYQNNMFRCSNCRQTDEVPTAMGIPIYNYCPNCGAQMKGDVEE